MKDTKSKFRQLYKDLRVSIAQISMEFRIECVNQAYCLMLGYNEEELIGKHLKEITHKETLEDNLRKQSQLAAGELDHYRMEKSFIHKNGSIVYGLLDASLVRDDNGNPLYFLGSVVDITDRKLVEIKLQKSEIKIRESEAHYRQLFHSLPYGAEIIDTNGKIINCSRSTSRMLGYERDELIGKHITTFVDEDTITIFKENFPKLVDGESLSLEGGMIHKDGSPITVLRSATPILNKDKEITGMLAISVDITERRQAEKALEKSEAKFRLLADYTLDWEYWMDSKGKFIYLSPSCERITGYSPKELISDPQLVFKMVEPDYAEKVHQQYMDEFKDNVSSFSIEFPILSKNGRKVWLEHHCNPIYDDNGNYVGRRGNNRDITDRKMAQESLIQSEHKFRNFFEFIPQPVSLTQINSGEIKDINKTFCEFTGYAVEELIGRKTTELKFYSQDDRKKILEKLQTSGEVYALEMDFRIKNGSIVNTIVFSRLIEIDQEKLLLSIFVDITEKLQLEEQYRQSLKMESIGTMAGGIAHDFNNILGIILGNVELAIEDVPEWSPSHSNLEEIKTASLRATNIVKQLLSFVRITEQKLQPIEIGLTIKDSLMFLRSTIPTTINIEQDIQITNETILADPDQINQIMMNLCINASHAMEETGGTLNVTVENVILDDNSTSAYPGWSPGEHINIRVSDTGPGITPEIIDRIFDPYFTTKKFGKGSGMGLAVVHGIVKNHNGTITVDSKPEKGTRFSILFPLAEKKQKVEAKTSEKLPKGSETILFVDDEISITKMAQKMLQRLGYKVETTITSQDALDRFYLNPDHFNLVITDMTMPQITGARLSEKLKEIRPDIPIIICTGHSDLVDEKKAKKLGIAAYVMKPISMLEIAQTIRKVLD